MGCCNATPDVANTRDIAAKNDLPSHPDKNAADEEAALKASRRLDRKGSIVLSEESHGNLSTRRKGDRESTVPTERSDRGEDVAGVASEFHGDDQSAFDDELPSKLEEEEEGTRKRNMLGVEDAAWVDTILAPCAEWREAYTQRTLLVSQQTTDRVEFDNDALKQKYVYLSETLASFGEAMLEDEAIQRSAQISTVEGDLWSELLAEEQEASEEVLRQMAEADSIDAMSSDGDENGYGRTDPENMFPTANLLAQIDKDQIEDEEWDTATQGQKDQHLQENGATWNLFFSGDHMSPGERARHERRRQLEEEEAEALRLDRLEKMRCSPSVIMKRLAANQPTLAFELVEATERDAFIRDAEWEFKDLEAEFVPAILSAQHAIGAKWLTLQFDAGLLLAFQRLESQRRLCLEDAMFKQAFFVHAERSSRFVAARKEWEREKAAMALRGDDRRLAKLAQRGILGGRLGAKGLEDREYWRSEMVRLGKTSSRNDTPLNGVRHPSGSPTRTVVNQAHLSPNPRGKALVKLSFASKSALEQEERHQIARAASAGAAIGTKSSSTSVHGSQFSTPNSPLPVVDRRFPLGDSSIHCNNTHHHASGGGSSRILDSLKPHQPSLQRLQKKLAPTQFEEERVRSSIELERKLRWDLLLLDHATALEEAGVDHLGRCISFSTAGGSRPSSAVRKRITTVREYEAEMQKVRLRLKELESGAVKEKYLTNQAQSHYLIVEHDEAKQRVKHQKEEIVAFVRLDEERWRLKEVVVAHDARRAHVKAEQQAEVDHLQTVEDSKKLLARVAINAIFRTQRLLPLYLNREEARMCINEQNRSYKLLVQHELMDRFDTVEYFDLVMAMDCFGRGERYKRITSASVTPQSVPAVEKVMRSNMETEFDDSFESNIVEGSRREAQAISMLPPQKIGYRVRAATNIQRVWRGYLSRSHFIATQRDGLIILRMGRLQTKQDVRFIKEIEHLRRVCIEDDWAGFDLFGKFFRATMVQFEKERLSAIKVQALWRGYHYKRRVLPVLQEGFYVHRLHTLEEDLESKRK